MRLLRLLPLAAGLLALGLLVRHVGPDALAVALTRIAWWQFALACLIHGVTMVLDTLGWRVTFGARPPPFHRLLAARCAGQALNVATALGGLGGEAIKAWMLRRDAPYEQSVPSLILAKTAEVTGQTLLLVTGILVAHATGVGWTLIGPMYTLLAVEVVAVGGFVLVQMTGGVGRISRILRWLGVGRGVRRVDAVVRQFYRAHWRSFLLSVASHFASWFVGTMEGLLILRSLHVPASVATATVVEALGTGVRFATFFVPASLGTLEGAIAAAFAALGWAASDGVAFSLVRRGRQVVWVGLGLVVLSVTGVRRATGEPPARPTPVRAD
jgi:uncharacterized protein (TIRG00374 family)